jgi:hypothetical protein
MQFTPPTPPSSVGMVLGSFQQLYTTLRNAFTNVVSTTESAPRIILQSANGTNFVITVDDEGNLLSGVATKTISTKGDSDVDSTPAGGTGSVTSVDLSGGTTGLTFTGGPIITAGTISLGGTLAVANGGTGSTTSTGTGAVVRAASPTITGTLTAATITATSISGAVSATTAAVSGLLSITQFAETYTAPAITSNVLTINLSAGTVFNVANNANITTFTISNATASKSSSFTIILTANGTAYTQAWGSSVKWPVGVAPTLTSTTGKIDIITFVTNDGGTTWFGFVGGQGF